MKQFNQKNQIWFEQDNGTVRVGFTKEFIDSLDQCWHIMPANIQKFREKGPLMVIETNDALISIMSPISANFVQWDAKAQNFPDQLTENDTILTMTTARAEARPREVAVMDEMAAMPVNINDWAVNPARVLFNGNGGIAAQNVRPRTRAEEELQRRAAQQAAAIRAQQGQF